LHGQMHVHLGVKPRFFRLRAAANQQLQRTK